MTHPSNGAGRALPTPSRRRFLATAGTLTMVGAVAACQGGESQTPQASAFSSASGIPSQYSGDPQQVAVAVALENLAVSVYDQLLSAASRGSYGHVPAAVTTALTTAGEHHHDHATAWNGVLSNGRHPTISGSPLTIAHSLSKRADDVRSVHEALELTRYLESTLAQTFTAMLGATQDANTIHTASTIVSVEAAHAAVLNFLLGDPPAPQAQLGIADAVPVTALTA